LPEWGPALAGSLARPSPAPGGFPERSRADAGSAGCSIWCIRRRPW